MAASNMVTWPWSTLEAAVSGGSIWSQRRVSNSNSCDSKQSASPETVRLRKGHPHPAAAQTCPSMQPYSYPAFARDLQCN
jgi:hypothetical protein